MSVKRESINVSAMDLVHSHVRGAGQKLKDAFAQADSVVIQGVEVFEEAPFSAREAFDVIIEKVRKEGKKATLVGGASSMSRILEVHQGLYPHVSSVNVDGRQATVKLG